MAFAFVLADFDQLKLTMNAIVDACCAQAIVPWLTSSVLALLDVVTTRLHAALSRAHLDALLALATRFVSLDPSDSDLSSSNNNNDDRVGIATMTTTTADEVDIDFAKLSEYRMAIELPAHYSSTSNRSSNTDSTSTTTTTNHRHANNNVAIVVAPNARAVASLARVVVALGEKLAMRHDELLSMIDDRHTLMFAPVRSYVRFFAVLFAVFVSDECVCSVVSSIRNDRLFVIFLSLVCVRLI